MENKMGCNSHDPEIRKGPWTMEEDLILINYIANHGEGVWNTVARSAGLKRTGKSCRLRWLNYLRPDVRRGNITPEEQLLIMELHSRWGNRWSKIARQLPGRTDNEIKNYWRTRIQKKAKGGAEHHLDYQNSAESLEGSGGRPAMIGMEEAGVGGGTSSANYTAGGLINYPHLIPPPMNDGAPNNVEAAAFWSMEDLWSTMQLFNSESMN